MWSLTPYKYYARAQHTHTHRKHKKNLTHTHTLRHTYMRIHTDQMRRKVSIQKAQPFELHMRKNTTHSHIHTSTPSQTDQYLHLHQ